MARTAGSQQATPGEPVRVQYAAPHACPDQRAFEAALAEHLGTATFARLDELARTLSVTVAPAPDGYRASIELVDRHGRATERSILAPNCEQAVQTIALVGALAVRSQAERLDAEPGAESGSEPPADPPPLTSSPQPVVARAVPAATPRSAPPPAPPRDEQHLMFETTAGAGLTTGVGPVVAPGLFLSGRIGVSGPAERSLRLSFLAHDTLRASLEAADVRFTLVRGRLELCPHEPSVSRAMILSPCAGFELGSQTGRTYADGERVASSGQASRLWVAGTLAIRLRIALGRASLDLGPELVVPFRRNRFALTRPETPVYEVPPVAVGAALGAGLAW